MSFIDYVIVEVNPVPGCLCAGLFKCRDGPLDLLVLLANGALMNWCFDVMAVALPFYRRLGGMGRTCNLISRALIDASGWRWPSTDWTGGTFGTSDLPCKSFGEGGRVHCPVPG